MTDAPDPLLRDLHIDGRVYRVEHAVWAHFKFMSDLLARMTDRVVALSRQGRAG